VAPSLRRQRFSSPRFPGPHPHLRSALPSRQNPNIVHEVKEGLGACSVTPAKAHRYFQRTDHAPRWCCRSPIHPFRPRELNLNPGWIGLMRRGWTWCHPRAFSRAGHHHDLAWEGHHHRGWLAGPHGLSCVVSGPIGYVVAPTTQILGSLTYTVANVQQWSLSDRYARRPCRVTASQLVYGAEAVGALMGGF